MSVLIINSLIFKHWKQLGRKREETGVANPNGLGNKGEQECQPALACESTETSSGGAQCV